MATGTIKTMRPEKGFGFIRRAGDAGGGSDLFFHRSAVQGVSFDELQEGQTVSFTEERDPRDPSRFRAVNVEAATTSGAMDDGE